MSSGISLPFTVVAFPASNVASLGVPSSIVQVHSEGTPFPVFVPAQCPATRQVPEDSATVSIETPVQMRMMIKSKHMPASSIVSMQVEDVSFG